METGAEMIKAERERHQLKWNAVHDDNHPGSLAVNAAELAVAGTYAEKPKRDPWGLVEKHKDNRIQQLVIAGALIAAEIDRLGRIDLWQSNDRQVVEAVREATSQLNCGARDCFFTPSSGGMRVDTACMCLHNITPVAARRALLRALRLTLKR